MSFLSFYPHKISPQMRPIFPYPSAFKMVKTLLCKYMVIDDNNMSITLQKYIVHGKKSGQGDLILSHKDAVVVVDERSEETTSHTGANHPPPNYFIKRYFIDTRVQVWYHLSGFLLSRYQGPSLVPFEWFFTQQILGSKFGTI